MGRHWHPEMENFKKGSHILSWVWGAVFIIMLAGFLQGSISEFTFFAIFGVSTVLTIFTKAVWYMNVPHRCRECNQLYEVCPWLYVTRENVENGVAPDMGLCICCTNKKASRPSQVP